MGKKVAVMGDDVAELGKTARILTKVTNHPREAFQLALMNLGRTFRKSSDRRFCKSGPRHISVEAIPEER